MAQLESQGTQKSLEGALAADEDDEAMEIERQQQLQWQAGEIYLFEQAVEKFGQKWTHVATEIPTRTARQIGAFARTKLGKRILDRVNAAQVRGIDWNFAGAMNAFAQAMNAFAQTMKRQRDHDIDEAEAGARHPQKKPPYQRPDSFDDA